MAVMTSFNSGESVVLPHSEWKRSIVYSAIPSVRDL